MDIYGTAAGFADYHAARGRDVGTYEADDIEKKLLVASEWIDGRYRSSFSGVKVGQRAQRREWPRNGAVDRDCFAISAAMVPVEVEFATYEAALRELQAPGGLSVDFTPNRYKRASVEGAVSVEYTQFDSASAAQTQYAIIAEILAPILTGSGAVSALSGSVSRA